MRRGALVLAFIATLVPALVFPGAASPRPCATGDTPVEVVVYGMTAAFGLEYLVASWGGIWQRG